MKKRNGHSDKAVPEAHEHEHEGGMSAPILSADDFTQGG